MPISTQNIELSRLARERADKIGLLLVQKIVKMDEKIDKISEDFTQKFDELTVTIQNVEKMEGPQGNPGDSIKGDPGESYILTEADKKEIAAMITVPIVEKVIEKTQVVNNIETIKEVPMITEVTKRIENPVNLQPMQNLINAEITALEEKIKELEKSIQTRPRAIQGVGWGRSVSYYDISSSLNGSTKSFWLPSHMGIIAVIGSSMPFIFRPTVDYKESGHNILFDSAIDATISLAAGQSVVVLIKRNS